MKIHYAIARLKVLAWEKQHANDSGITPPPTPQMEMAQNKYSNCL